MQERRRSLGEFFLVLLCFSELLHLKIGQFTMFQNITAHFRIETGLIFQSAAITGKGKAGCLRKPSSIRGIEFFTGAKISAQTLKPVK